MNRDLNHMINGMDIMDRLEQSGFLNNLSELDPRLAGMIKVANADDDISKQEAVVILSEYGNGISGDDIFEVSKQDESDLRIKAMTAIQEHGLAAQDLDGSMFQGLTNFLASKQYAAIGGKLSWDVYNDALKQLDEQIEIAYNELQEPGISPEEFQRRDCVRMSAAGHYLGLKNNLEITDGALEEANTFLKEHPSAVNDDPHIRQGVEYFFQDKINRHEADSRQELAVQDELKRMSTLGLEYMKEQGFEVSETAMGMAEELVEKQNITQNFDEIDALQQGLGAFMQHMMNSNVPLFGPLIIKDSVELPADDNSPSLESVPSLGN